MEPKNFYWTIKAIYFVLFVLCWMLFYSVCTSLYRWGIAHYSDFSLVIDKFLLGTQKTRSVPVDLRGILFSDASWALVLHYLKGWLFFWATLIGFKLLPVHWFDPLLAPWDKTLSSWHKTALRERLLEKGRLTLWDFALGFKEGDRLARHHERASRHRRYHGVL